jgi:hypothetical protein
MEIDPKDYDKLYAIEGQYIMGFYPKLKVNKDGVGLYLDVREIVDVIVNFQDFGQCILIVDHDFQPDESHDPMRTALLSIYSKKSITELLIHICEKKHVGRNQIPYLRDHIGPERHKLNKPPVDPVLSRNELLDISG